MSTTGQAPVPPVPPVGAPGPPPGPLRMTSGRWIALAIGVPVALALIGWTGFSLVTTVARGSYPFSYTVPVDDGQVAVNINTGNITLREAPGSTAARLSGIVQYGLFRPGISENTTPAGANIGMTCSGINTDCGMNAILDVPPRTAVTVWSNGGDVTAANFSSGMTLWTEGGNVSATDLSGNLQLDTGGGDLNSIGLTGAIQVATGGGNINGGNWTGSGTTRIDTGGGDLTANGITGKFQLSTEGGNVDASGVASGTVNMDSGGGDVTLAFTQVPSSLVITAQGGNVTVILPPGNTTYALSLPGTQGGNVSYPSSLISSKSTTHKITIDSGGGDITISQG